MATLGNASLKLSTDATGLSSGLNAATSQIQSWGTQLSGGISGGISGLVSGFTAVAGPAAIIAGLVGAITNGFSRLNQVANQTKTALALGVDPQDFQATSLILERCGIAAEHAGEFIGNFEKKLERAASSGAGPANRALEKLGLNAQSLLALPFDQQLSSIAQGLSQMAPGGERTAAAVALLGNNAVQMLPMLSKGADGIRQFIEQARADGVLMTNDQSKAALEASKAWNDAKRSLTRAWDSISLSVAQALTPIITLAAKVFSGIVSVVKWCVDSIKSVFTTTYEVVEPVITFLYEGFIKVKDFIVNAVTQIFANFNISFPSIRDIVLACWQAIAIGGAYLWDSIKAGMGAMAVAIGWMWENLTAKIYKGLSDLLHWAAEKIPDAIRPSWLDNATKGLDTIANSTRQLGADTQAWGRQAINSFGSSHTAVNNYFNNLRQRQRQSVNDAVAGANAIAQTNREALSIGKMADNKALIKGSAEEYTFRTQWAETGQLARQLDLTQRQLEELRGLRQDVRARGNRAMEFEEIS